MPRQTRFTAMWALMSAASRASEPQDEEADDGDHRQSEKGDRAAEVVAQIACVGRADRSADSDRGADDPLSEIEIPGAARDVSDDERTMAACTAAAMPSSSWVATSR